ncbi:MAG: hypothetical protein IK016_11375 [Lachnospiraceae bacterium]|nr:hypothetical protein [Lachnospiraceae bacterium]
MEQERLQISYLQREEREIDLKQLMVVVLAKWRLIVIVVIFCMLSGAAAGAFRNLNQTEQEGNPQEMSDVASSSETKPMTPEEYRAALEDYQADQNYYNSATENYQQWIREDTALLNERDTYLKTSILKGIDPYHVAYSIAEIHILKEDTALGRAEASGRIVTTDREMLRLLRLYQSYLTDSALLDKCAKQLQTEEKYIREIVSCSTDGNIGYVLLSIRGQSTDTTEIIMDTMLSDLDEIHQEISETISVQHDAVVLWRNHYYGIDDGLVLQKTNEMQGRFNQKKRIADNILALEKLDEPVLPTGLEASADYDDDGNKMTADGADAFSATEANPPGAALRWAFLAACFGCFATIFLFAMYYVLTGRALSAGEMADNYRLHMIGMLSSEGAGASRIDRKLVSLGADYAYDHMTVAEQLAVVKTNLSVYAPETNAFLLVGSVNRQVLEQTAGQLRQVMPEATFSCAARIHENVASLEELRRFEQIILVEEPLRSKYGQMDREIRMIAEWKKLIVGLIAVKTVKPLP